MTTPSPLLRTLLILAILFNGAGLRAFSLATPALDEASETCHDMANRSAVPVAAEAPPSGDCCDGGQCDCACATPPTFAMAGLVIPFQMPPALPDVIVSEGPATEARGSPFRPPIA